MLLPGVASNESVQLYYVYGALLWVLSHMESVEEDGETVEYHVYMRYDVGCKLFSYLYVRDGRVFRLVSPGMDDFHKVSE